MKKLSELNFLHNDMQSLEGGAAELHLLGATGIQFANTKDLKVQNYDFMMARENKKLYL